MKTEKPRSLEQIRQLVAANPELEFEASNRKEMYEWVRETLVNRAEQALRTAVQWRKTSFGNRSQAGSVATARLLTVAQTCRQQNRETLG